MTFPRVRSKFGVRQDAVGKAERTYKGITYHSRAEASYASKLDLLVAAGEIVRWERQRKFTFWGHEDCERCAVDPAGTYVADFAVWTSGSTGPPDRVVEVKGVMTAVARRKLKLFRAIYSNIELVIVKRGVEQ